MNTLKQLLATILIILPLAASYSQISVETIQGRCTNIQMSDRPILGVADFIYSARNGSNQVGTGLSDMLSNALVEIGCYSIVERQRLNDVLQEQSIGQQGFTSSESAPSSGALMGARYVVMGNITEFKENESGVTGVGFIKALGGGFGKTQAHIGMIIKLVDAVTGQVIISKSIDKKVKKVGIIGGQGLLGLALAGSFKSQAMEDAIEEAIIETVQLITNQKDVLEASSRNVKSAQLTPENCSLLAMARKPRVMVVVPEEHLDSPVPDPAGETEIIKTFLSYGFTVIDPQQVQAIRDQEATNLAIHNLDAAVSLGQEFAADIIIVGEAFSQSSGREGNMNSCRARVEVRAIDTRTGQILATDGKHAAAVDVAEAVAAKAALRNAGEKAAQSLLEQVCSYSDLSANTQGRQARMEIILANASYTDVNALSTLLEEAVDGIQLEKSFAGKTGRFNVTSPLSIDDMATAISNHTDKNVLQITGFEKGKLTLTVL